MEYTVVCKTGLNDILLPLQQAVIVGTAKSKVRRCSKNFVEYHKHSVCELSANGKWREHIRQLTEPASKVLGMMRAVKFKRNRNSLNKLSISFMRPILEYARLRTDCSDLKFDLYKNYISESRSNLYNYGYYVEDAEHYFSHCSHITITA